MGITARQPAVLMTADMFITWLGKALPRLDRLTYHAGHLAEDAIADPTGALAALRDCAQSAEAEGLVVLAQRRCDAGFEYIAWRLDRHLPSDWGTMVQADPVAIEVANLPDLNTTVWSVVGALVAFGPIVRIGAIRRHLATIETTVHPDELILQRVSVLRQGLRRFGVTIPRATRIDGEIALEIDEPTAWALKRMLDAKRGRG